MRKKTGDDLEFMLFPDIPELHKKCTGSTHATFSVALRQGRCKLFFTCSEGARCANMK